MSGCASEGNNGERGKYVASDTDDKSENNKKSEEKTGQKENEKKESKPSSMKDVIKKEDNPSKSDSEEAIEEEKERQSLDSDEDGGGKIYYSSMPDDRQTIINNIQIDTEHNDKLLMVVMTNNNSFVIPDLDVQAIFYKEGQMIGSDKDGHDVVLPGHSVASRLDIPEGSDEYDVSISVDWHYATGYRNWTDQVSVESNKGERCVMISFTNNGDVDIRELEYVVALYKNGKFVDITYPRDVYDFYSGSTIVEKADTYSTDFDDYKIFINQAHTF